MLHKWLVYEHLCGPVPHYLEVITPNEKIFLVLNMWTVLLYYWQYLASCSNLGVRTVRLSGGR
jgi:hypothetical protein